MTTDLPLRCSCSAMQGVVHRASPKHGTRLSCLCDDCQIYAHFLGRDGDILDESGGTELYQTTPARVEIVAGVEQLRCTRLTGRGMLRFHAGCCNTPVANLMPLPRLPFVGLHRAFIDVSEQALGEAVGPVLARVNARFATGPLRPGSSPGAPVGVIVRSLRNLALGFVKREAKPSAFFEDRSPVVVPRVLEASELEELRSRSRRPRMVRP